MFMGVIITSFWLDMKIRNAEKDTSIGLISGKMISIASVYEVQWSSMSTSG